MDEARGLLIPQSDRQGVVTPQWGAMWVRQLVLVREFMTDPKDWELLGPDFISRQDSKYFKVPLKKSVIE